MTGATLTGGPSRFAYAFGVGLALIPLLGIPVRFAFQGIAPLLVFTGAFLLGLLLGALFAPRGVGTRSETT